MAGRKTSWTKEKAMEAGIAWIQANQRWPNAHDMEFPFSGATATRMYGSWSACKSALRQTYTKEHGIPEWDERRPRLSGQRSQLFHETLEMLEASLLRVNSLRSSPPPRPATPRKADRDACELHLLISDVHVGEYNDPALMSGLVGEEGFDFDTFSRAADTLEERVLFFNKLYSKAWSLDKLVVNFLGDMVTGEQIFLGQALQIDRILSDQVFEAAHRFASMLSRWAKHFPQVEVYCMPGNHGRLGKKNELHWRSNMDYIAYRVMATLLRDHKTMRFVISDGPVLIVEHGDNWRFLLHHGDSLRGGGPTQGNLVNLERKVHAISQMADVPLHYSLSGHFHRSVSAALAGGGRLIGNGSFPGGSPYSVNELNQAHVPSQKLLLFSPSRGVFNETDIQLGPRIQLTADRRRVLTRHYREG